MFSFVSTVLSLAGAASAIRIIHGGAGGPVVTSQGATYNLRSLEYEYKLTFNLPDQRGQKVCRAPYKPLKTFSDHSLKSGMSYLNPKRLARYFGIDLKFDQSVSDWVATLSADEGGRLYAALNQSGCRCFDKQEQTSFRVMLLGQNSQRNWTMLRTALGVTVSEDMTQTGISTPFELDGQTYYFEFPDIRGIEAYSLNFDADYREADAAIVMADAVVDEVAHKVKAFQRAQGDDGCDKVIVEIPALDDEMSAEDIENLVKEAMEAIVRASQ